MDENNEIPMIKEDIFAKIKSMIPEEAGYVKSEFEGPDIVIYVKNSAFLYENENMIRNIAIAIKKKIILRSDSASLMNPEEALKIINEIVPKEAVVNNVRFVPEFNEVYIESLKPGLVIGKSGSTLKAIAIKTGWLAKTQRTPTMSSDTITGVRKLLFNESAFRKKFLTSVGKKINAPIIKSEWLKVTALGGFREVGRSSLLLETPHSKVMIDCGISPEPAIKGINANDNSDVNKAFPYLDSANISINELDAVILTHAHMDHAGFVPYLYKFGYTGPVYCTPPTRDLTALLLNDYIRLVQKSGGAPLYEEKDIKKMLLHMVTRDYGEVTNITDEIKLTYHNAGHILGSATLHLHIGEGMYNIVHTGDMKYGFTRLYDPAKTKYPRIDSLFIESTYGYQKTAMPSNRHESERNLMEMIKRTIDGKGKVLIPLFAVGRAQELQLVLENYMTMVKNYDFDVPVFLDGMILESSAIHTAYPEYLKESLKNRILNNRSPFESEIFEVVKGERDVVYEGGPAIILASGGMMNGGSSVEYFKRLADDPKNTLIFTGYQSAGSLGRRIQNGINEVPLPNEDGKIVPFKVNMNVATAEGFSGHSDRRQLINFMQDIRPRPKNIFTMHGEEHSCEELARAAERMLHIDARAPRNLDSTRLK
ncbi:MAG: beta-CASP ribonuclease aCPSF1 [Candidatus Marsarchaeota archaeon]|nr:beta-CASP ribonuclease aCPSF1 [Candidatus Marsarchaeota archaeon]